ncbi:MAG: hypothetical protein ACJATI_003458 [Halioglobus sp.]|jgi:hypothetical protein
MMEDTVTVNDEDLVLIGTFAIRGINYQNDDGSWRKDNYKQLEYNTQLDLVLDNNEYDSNSILITSSEGDLGYIPKNMTSKIRRHSNKYLVALLIPGQAIEVYYDSSKLHTPTPTPPFDFNTLVLPILFSILGWSLYFNGFTVSGFLIGSIASTILLLRILRN